MAWWIEGEIMTVIAVSAVDQVVVQDGESACRSVLGR
jgi:hypothetical protein